MRKYAAILVFLLMFSLTSCRQFNSTTRNGEIEFTEDNTALETGVSKSIQKLADLNYLNSYDGKILIKVSLKKEDEKNYEDTINAIKEYLSNFKDDEWEYLKIEVKDFKDYEYNMKG